MDYHDPHKAVEPLEKEVAEVGAALALLLAGGHPAAHQL